jgi:multiple sugar transport system substrate-binding protein
VSPRSGEAAEEAAVRSASARALGGCLVALMVCALAACTGDSSSSGSNPQTSSPPTTSPPQPVDLSFGVYGSTEEIAAYSRMAHHFDSVNDQADVTIESWRDHDGLRKAVETGQPLPDVFLVSRRDLQWYTENHLNQPVDSLLDERGVDFGDAYSRDAITAFSSDNRLQCMPYGVEPQVVFYNEDLVDFTRMAARGIDVPTDHRRWTWDQFVAAATFASRPGRGTKSVSVEPTLRGIAPFLYSGGGDLFDDDGDPTSLAFASDGSQSALATMLALFRDPKLTLTEEQLSEQSAQAWFEKGQLAMMVGSRALVPELRQVPGLQFDVMPIPSIHGQATIGEISGLCISQDADSPAVSADFLVYATGTDAVTEVSQAGYLQPANQEVAFGDGFLQPDKLPVSATVFNESVARMVIPPLLDDWDQLEAATAPYLQQLFYDGPTIDLPTLGEQIDAVSQPILNPPTATPTPTPGSPSLDPTASSSP